MRFAVLATGFIALACVGAQADDKQICGGIDAGSDKLRLARITGRDTRVNFIASRDENARTRECPSASTICKRNVFVVPGDRVLVDETEGDYSCASFVSARGSETSGWLPKAALDMPANPAPPALADWTGKWKRVEASIEIKLRGPDLEASGDATWGAGDPRRVRSGGVNIGEFSGKSRPSGNRLAFGEGYDGVRAPDAAGGKDDFDCRVRLYLLGPYLAAQDNRKCGGNNVSFTGVYVRVAK